MPFVSKLFPKWHCKRLFRTDPLKALVIGGFVRGLSMRDIESLCEEAGLGKIVALDGREDLRGAARALRGVQGAARSMTSTSSCCSSTRSSSRSVRSGPKEGVICAWGIDENGHRQLVAVQLGARESKEDWLELGRDLIDPRPGRTAAGRRRRRARADHQRSRRSGHALTVSTAAFTASGTCSRSCPRQEHDRVRFNYWAALTDATSVKDGKLRLQVLISELESSRLRVRRPLPRRGPRRAGRAPPLPAPPPRAVAVNRTSSSDRSVRSAGAPK